MSVPSADESAAFDARALPTIPVEPELLHELDAVLREGETREQFVEAAVRAAVWRRVDAAALARRAEASWLEYQSTGQSVPAEEVLNKLDEMVRRRRQDLSR